MDINLFGTDGIRCTVGTSPFTITDLPHLGNAIAQWAHTTYGTRPEFLIACDTRISREWIISSLKAGLLLSSITLHDADILPTPAVMNLLQHNPHMHGGIIISASHNPFEYNGIKIVDRVTGKLSEEHELDISRRFHQRKSASYHHFGNTQYYSTAQDEYAHHITDLFESSALKNLTVVLDCANGATYRVASAIFEALGARTIPINNNPNGKNINHECGSLHTKDLQHAVVASHADIGFAFDGDGDRVIAVNRLGQVKNGDDMLAILIDNPRYVHEQYVVGTIMSNHGFDLFLKQKQKKLVRTSVGDKYVADHLNKNGILLGGEQSGHIIMHDYLSTGDGIMTALRIVETLRHTHNWDMETFQRYPQILTNIPVGHKKDLREPAIASIIAQHEQQLDSGRLIVRYSGTENVLRIMVEDRHEATAQQISTRLANALQKELL